MAPHDRNTTVKTNRPLLGDWRDPRKWTFITLGALCILVGLLASMMLSPGQVTRIRNSLLAEVGAVDDFEWPPDAWPADFEVESAIAPPEFIEAATTVEEVREDHGRQWARAVALARLLASGPGTGAAVQSSTVDTYRAIRNSRCGYCADFSQVFNGLAHAAKIPVREWGMSFEGFGGEGHAFNEVYDDTLGKWVFIDSYFSFFVQNPKTAEPLSAMEFRGLLRAGATEDDIEVVAITCGRFRFESAADAIAYYRQGADQFFLWYGNNVFSYDAHPLVAKLGRMSRAVEQGAAILAGIHPHLRIVPSETNRAAVNALFRTRNLFVTGATIAALLVVILCVQVGRWTGSGLNRSIFTPDQQ